MIGISQFLGFVALLGFLMFIGGIGLAVASSSQGKKMQGGIFIATVGAIVGVLFTIVSQGIIVVGPTERVVVFQTIGGTLQEPLLPGTHVIVPVLQQPTVYSVAQKNLTMGNEVGGAGDPITALTVDGQSVTFDITVLYSVNPEAASLNVLHQRWNVNYEAGFVIPTVRNLAREEVSKYRAADIYGIRRAAMEEAMESAVEARFATEGLILTDLQIRDIQFSTQFREAIERAQIAAQEAEQAALRVEQRRQEAQQVEETAKGEANAAIARANGEAQAIRIRAQAEAEALSLISTQLKANPLLIQYQWITSLAPNVNLAVIPSNSPFIFDFESITNLPEADTNFVAPAVATPEPTPTPRP